MQIWVHGQQWSLVWGHWPLISQCEQQTECTKDLCRLEISTLALTVLILPLVVEHFLLRMRMLHLLCQSVCPPSSRLQSLNSYWIDCHQISDIHVSKRMTLVPHHVGHISGFERNVSWIFPILKMYFVYIAD